MSTTTVEEPRPTTHNPRPATDRLLRGRSGRRIRHDALPEHSGYIDDGCDLAPECLRCPLERCRYDTLGGRRRLVRAGRDDTLRRRDAGDDIVALASEFGVSPRTVFRALRGSPG